MKLLLIPIYVAIAVVLARYQTADVADYQVAYYFGSLAGYIGIPILLYFTIKYTCIFIGKFFAFIAISIKKKSESNSQKITAVGKNINIKQNISDKEPKE